MSIPAAFMTGSELISKQIAKASIGVARQIITSPSRWGKHSLVSLYVNNKMAAHDIIF